MANVSFSNEIAELKETVQTCTTLPIFPSHPPPSSPLLPRLIFPPVAHACWRSFFFFLPDTDVRLGRASANPVFLTGILNSRHRATNFNGDRGSVELSTRSPIAKVVPSTSFTIAVSDFGPESSTARMDFAESLRIMSKSAEVIEGMESALAMLGVMGARRNERAEKLVIRVRRCIILLLSGLGLLLSKSTRSAECSFV